MARSVDDVKAVPGKIGAAQSSCARAGFDAVRCQATVLLPRGRSVCGLMSGQIESGNGVERRALMTIRCCDLRPRRH